MDEWVRDLSSKDAQERQTAASRLGETSDARAVSPLISVLDDPDLLVRIFAIQSLSKLKDTRAVEPLCELLKTESCESFIVSNIMQALTSINSEKAIPALVAALDSENAFMRFEAAEALAEIGNPTNISALEQLLADDTTPGQYNMLGGYERKLRTVAEMARDAIELIRGRGSTSFAEQ